MKLHLPQRLRRALYHAFIATLSGAAALAAPAWADVSLPDGFIAPTASGMNAHHEVRAFHAVFRLLREVLQQADFDLY